MPVTKSRPVHVRHILAPYSRETGDSLLFPSLLLCFSFRSLCFSQCDRLCIHSRGISFGLTAGIEDVVRGEIIFTAIVFLAIYHFYFLVCLMEESFFLIHEDEFDVNTRSSLSGKFFHSHSRCRRYRGT